MNRFLSLLTISIFSSQLSIADDLAPTEARIISQNNSIAWVKFRDNSDGDFFRFYFDGQANSEVIADSQDTQSRNGKSRVLPLKINNLEPNKAYKVTIGVIKDNQKVVESQPFDLTLEGATQTDQAPKILKVFKGSERYTWIKFRDNSNGDFFRFYFDGEVNTEARKDTADTTARNGKFRMVPIDITKLTPNSQINLTIGVIKGDEKIAESKEISITTGDKSDLKQAVIDFNKEHGLNGNDFEMNIYVRFLLDNHLAIIEGSPFPGSSYINVYRIDDNNNITYLNIFDNMLGSDSHEFSPMDHEYYSFTPYDNNTKLKVELTHSDTVTRANYDIRDLDNIIRLGEPTTYDAVNYNWDE